MMNLIPQQYSPSLESRIEQLFLQSYRYAVAMHRSDLIGDIVKLWRALTQERADSLAHYFKNPGLKRAYIGYYMPLYAAKIALLLERLNKEGLLYGFNHKPLRVLDLGSGPLVGVLASRLAFGPLQQAIAADRDIAPMRSGYDFLKTFLKKEEVEQIFLRRINLGIFESFVTTETFDLIILSHVINEFGSSSRFLSKKLNLVLAAMKMLADGGRLLIVEPGNRVCSRDMMSLRDALFKESSVDILAPCTGALECPLLKTASDWCHGELAWKRPDVCAKIDQKIGFDKSLLKYSYLLLGKKNTKPKDVTKHWRVVSGHMCHKGIVRRYVCTSSELLTLCEKENVTLPILKPLLRGELINPSDLNDQVQTSKEKAF